MAKKKRKGSLRVPPVDPAELMFAFGLADAAASLRMPVENPAAKIVNLIDKEGKVLRIRFTDRPINRAGMAVAAHFQGVKFKSIVMRLFAFYDIYKHPELSQWRHKASDGRMELAKSIIAAAARAPLIRNSRFDPDTIAKLALEYEKEEDRVDELPS